MRNLSGEILTIEATTECNSACSNCFARAGIAAPSSMGLETALEIAVEGREMGYGRLHVTGGEPLLWPHLRALLFRAAKMGYGTVFFNTNGSLADTGFCRGMAPLGGKIMMSVSLNGGERIHDAMRGDGSCRAAMAGIRNSLDSGTRTMIFSTVGRRLLGELPGFADMVTREFCGIESLTFIQMIRVHGDAFDVRSELLGPEEFIRFVAAVSSLGLYGLPVSIMENPLANAVASKMGLGYMPSSHSRARHGRLAVLADGSITLHHSSRDRLGTYRKGALKEIIASVVYREKTGRSKECLSCRHGTLCAEHGVAWHDDKTRDMVDSPYCMRVLDLV
ncbi:MAG: radical SAM protein [Spirochaetes bacterium]|jgi:MoaA/NifB/PqqE/SkfB family radical SAM enzyme|nr:radical SAM protein [Spirochaetota bacterium]